MEDPCNSDRDTPGPTFPRSSESVSTADVELFREGYVAGRLASQQRMPLNFYQKMAVDELPTMVHFLNYVIWYGDAVTHEVVSVTRSCLYPWDEQYDEEETKDKFPVWGHHQTFEVGHCKNYCQLLVTIVTDFDLTGAFYALLSTKIGKQLLLFLAKHKTELGRKLLHSVTVFAADSTKARDQPSSQRQLSDLAKWPVLVWKVVDYDPAVVESKTRLEKEYTSPNGVHRGRGIQQEAVWPRISCRQLAEGTRVTMPRVELPLEELLVSARHDGNTLIRSQT
jgi:hypothetical protein